MSRVRSVRAWGPSTGPTACALAGRRCSLWGWRKGVPGGGAFHHCEGRLRSGAVSPPTARPLGGLLGSATHVLWARVCGCGGPTLSPWPACPVGAACRGGGGGPSPGGWIATVVRGAWCQALSLPQPPVLWSGQPGFRDPCVLSAVGAGVGTQHRPHSVRPLRAIVARCGVGGRASPGGGAFHHCEGRLRSGAVPPPTARLLAGLLGLVRCVRCVWCLCCACRGARCRSSLVPLELPSLVSRCGVVLAVCLPCPLPCARPVLGRWLPLVPFLASLLFTLSSTLLPGMHFFPASALVRVSVFFLAGSSFSLVGPSPLQQMILRMWIPRMWSPKNTARRRKVSAVPP